MYKRILFPVEDDRSLEAAITAVTAYAKLAPCEVRVLHTHYVDDRTPGGAGWHLVGSVVNRLRKAGVNAVGETRHMYRHERVGTTVARAAVAADADLVIVGSRGRSDLGALFLGSVSDAVAGGLDAPVLIVRGTSEQAAPSTIIAAVDGSQAADDAAADAAELAEAFGGRLILLHVRQFVAAEGAAVVESDEMAHEILRRALARAQRPGLLVIPRAIVAHSVVDAIVTAARDEHAGLVVLASRRPSPLNGLLMGSVAHGLVHRTRCPVLLAGRVRKPAWVS